MELITEIPIRKTSHSRVQELDFEQMEFGKHISDHMLVSDYYDGQWQQPQIVPYANLALSPATLALHYGQTVFEGMKAFRLSDGNISIFRLERHYERFARSLERMCMEVPPYEFFVEGMRQLIATDAAWVPRQKGASLYIRPFMYASEARFGVKVSEEYCFIIFTGPVPELYTKPISVKVETHFIRAAKGGTGYAKCGGNYGAAFYPTREARKQGYDQVLWTTGNEQATIEESGTMNVMFVINNSLVTPPVSDSILEGITRDSLLTLAKDLGINTIERPVSVRELEEGLQSGMVTEAFGAGTAAVVAPISRIGIDDKDFILPVYTNNNILNKLKARLDAIRYGEQPDVHGWNTIIPSHS
jgi:branched-chain amino acid aminotransferase